MSAAETVKVTIDIRAVTGTRTFEVGVRMIEREPRQRDRLGFRWFP